MRISRQGGGYTLETEQWLARQPTELFPFFAQARNLERITPGLLRFAVLTPEPIEMEVGTVIDYRLRLHGVPMRWRTRIVVWEPPHRFVDEQVRGPYRLWRHEHRFVEQAGGTLMRDQVDYRVPGGAVVHRLMVRRDVVRIFAYRAQVLEQMFGEQT